MAAKKTSASKASGKAASKKPKATGVTQKAAIKKAVVKKAAVKKATAKKFVAKKPPVKKTLPKTKAAGKKSVAKKIAPKKTVSKKAAAKKTVSIKTIARKTVVPKTSVSKTIRPKTPARKTVAAKPVTKTVTAARVSLPAVRKAAPLKSGTGKVPVPQNRTKINPPLVAPLKGPVRRPASIIPRAKTAKAALPNLTTSARLPVRASISPRKAARSAARGLAPASMPASEKTRACVDEALSEQKLREHIRTAVLYLEAWLRTSGAEVTPVVMELAAPAEAARAQIWRWLDREARFEDGSAMTPSLFEEKLHLELELLRKDMGPQAYDEALFVSAAQLFLDSVMAADFEDFPGSNGKPQD